MEIRFRSNVFSSMCSRSREMYAPYSLHRFQHN